ncbi:MAG: TetR/AcrR family transcriptional regulator [Pseudomonadota bacterium]
MTAPQRLTDRKRLAILTAAADQFRSFGFDASSMDKIAAAAGVSKRTVYNHFPSKEELFAETLLQLFQRYAEDEEVPYRGDVALAPQLTELLQRKVRTMADPAFLSLARVAVAEAIHAPERTAPILARLGEQEHGVTAWIRAALADGRLAPCDPLFAAALLQGQVKAVAFWPQVSMGAPPVAPALQADLIEAAVSMFLGYFAQPKQTA